MEVAPSPRHPPKRGSKLSSAKRRAETVDTEGMWCCIVRRPAAAMVRASGEEEWRRGGSSVAAARHDEENATTGGNAGSAKNSKEFVLRPKELEALIKQGTGIVVERTSKGSPFRLRLSPGRVSPISETAIVPVTASSSPALGKSSSGKMLMPASPPVDKARASPTLMEMMALEQDIHSSKQSVMLSLPRPPSVQEKVDAILLLRSPGNQFNDPSSSDVKLTITGRDGFSVSINVHRHILTAQSRFFAAKFSDWWSKQHRMPLNAVEISDCEDVDLYLQTIRLMYCRDLRRSLIKESVTRVLGILKVSAAILFEAGVVSCLEYLEAMPWPEDEEERVTSLVSQLQLDSVASMEVLKRLSSIEMVETESIVARLLQSVIQGTDEKARRETKTLVSRMLRENPSVAKDSWDSCRGCIYRACESCLEALSRLFTQVIESSNAAGYEKEGTLGAQISRQADNLNWMVDILIDREIADTFVKIWASQAELASLYSRIPSVYRYDVSRITARLCMAIGKGQVLVPQDVRFLLLQTWFQPLVDDFGWLQRCCKSLDKKSVEEGISQTILTLPLKQQQFILLGWFDCFSRSAGDCPNLNRAFEVWWRRTFVRPLLETSCVHQLTN
ncbi:BTB/POZ domain-containing protein At1g63850 [Selaginella moellendorffii]|nr:BTB/POZ domain-containing protein At1g63850 [Selaginella moellendorffii]XP_024535202.1 BTB/POZ domain-containing protein At1g63850 [Selaginella moellendorffii]|eukprot:XP_002974611.2 BTB/POZ domain-containing protein At1g63850 [Selaginella moellendorffii]